MDYIYRANSDNQKRAEQAAAELGGKIDKLIERRRSLEAEQSALWSEIAFQAVASRDLSSKPIYRFNLKSTQQDQSADHIAAAQAACDFVRTTNQLMDDAQKGVENDPGSVFHQFSVAVSSARKTLNDRLAEQESLALDLSDNQTKISKVNTVAKRIDELARNLDDSYRLARDGDVAGDDQRKNTFRGQLQDGLLNTADTAVTADQCILDVVTDWKLTPDVKKPSTQASLHIDIPASTQSPQPVVASDKGSTHVDSQTQVPAETRVDRANVKIEWKLENINQYERLKLVNSWQNLQPKTKLSAQRADGMLAFTRQDSPYLITGPLLISRGATLTIEPGVVVLFGPHANIDNQGTIIAISNTAWIVLANAIPTDWHGIPPGALNEGGADPPSNWVGIHTTGSIELQRCLITGAIEGLETDITGKLSATDCIFAANGGTLSCGGGSRGTVRDSLFFRNGVGPFGHGGNSKCDFSKCLLLFNGVGCTANSGNPCSGDNSTFYGNEIAIQASNKRDLVRVTQSNIFTTTGKPLGSRGGKSVVTGNYWGNEVPSSDPKQDTSHSLRSPVKDAMPSLPPCEYLCLDAADGAKTMVDP